MFLWKLHHTHNLFTVWFKIKDITWPLTCLTDKVMLFYHVHYPDFKDKTVIHAVLILTLFYSD